VRLDEEELNFIVVDLDDWVVIDEVLISGCVGPLIGYVVAGCMTVA
jgi:hypothetical protein